MKKIEKKIEKLYEELECGLYERKEAFRKCTEIRNEIRDKFEEGTDNYIHLICLLIDCTDLASEIAA